MCTWMMSWPMRNSHSVCDFSLDSLSCFFVCFRYWSHDCLCLTKCVVQNVKRKKKLYQIKQEDSSTLYAILALFMSSQCWACEQSTDMLWNECTFHTKWLSFVMSVNFSTLEFFCSLQYPCWVEYKSIGKVLS